MQDLHQKIQLAFLNDIRDIFPEQTVNFALEEIKKLESMFEFQNLIFDAIDVVLDYHSHEDKKFVIKIHTVGKGFEFMTDKHGDDFLETVRAAVNHNLDGVREIENKQKEH